jgi:hypothetical protein
MPPPFISRNVTVPVASAEDATTAVTVPLPYVTVAGPFSDTVAAMLPVT